MSRPPRPARCAATPRLSRSDQSQASENFTAVQVFVTDIDWLHLGSSGHRRAAFQLEQNNWVGRWMTPENERFSPCLSLPRSLLPLARRMISSPPSLRQRSFASCRSRRRPASPCDLSGLSPCKWRSRTLRRGARSNARGERLLALCGIAMLCVRAFAIPIINTARDEMLAGDKTASLRFARWHGGTVMLNVIEMLALAAIVFLLLATAARHAPPSSYRFIPLSATIGAVQICFVHRPQMFDWLACPLRAWTTFAASCGTIGPRPLYGRRRTLPLPAPVRVTRSELAAR